MDILKEKQKYKYVWKRWLIFQTPAIISLLIFSFFIIKNFNSWIWIKYIILLFSLISTIIYTIGITNLYVWKRALKELEQYYPKKKGGINETGKF